MILLTNLNISYLLIIFIRATNFKIYLKSKNLQGYILFKIKCSSQVEHHGE